MSEMSSVPTVIGFTLSPGPSGHQSAYSPGRLQSSPAAPGPVSGAPLGLSRDSSGRSALSLALTLSQQSNEGCASYDYDSDSEMDYDSDDTEMEDEEGVSKFAGADEVGQSNPGTTEKRTEPMCIPTTM